MWTSYQPCVLTVERYVHLRATGIEPAPSAWQAGVLPVILCTHLRTTGLAPAPSAWKAGMLLLTPHPHHAPYGICTRVKRPRTFYACLFYTKGAKTWPGICTPSNRATALCCYYISCAVIEAEGFEPPFPDFPSQVQIPSVASKSGTLDRCATPLWDYRYHRRRG